MTKALLNRGRYTASAPELVGDLASFMPNILNERGEDGVALIGFDYPIGLPKAYADKACALHFLPFIKSLTTESEFFQVCINREEITIKRPFYPNAPGGRARHHLTDALGIEYDRLLRTCEQQQEDRRAAGALFWTLGAKQVGKAAITGWRDVLAPALRKEDIQIWPFEDTLEALLKPGKTVVTETYPAQYYSGIFGALEGAKGDQEARRTVAPKILDWAKQRNDRLKLSHQLQAEITAGFNRGKDDAFDAVIGLFGMIDSIQNYSSDIEPKDHTVRHIEGWILGQPMR